MALLIPLTRDKFAIVDADDFAGLSVYNWYAFHSKGLWYAARKAGLKDTEYKYRDVIFMHKQLMNTSSLVDHANKNGLDNQRENLRSATYSQNNANRTSRPGSSSQYLGVRWDPTRQQWAARCRGKFLGRFSEESAAARAYDSYAVEEFGEFANLNFK